MGTLLSRYQGDISIEVQQGFLRRGAAFLTQLWHINRKEKEIPPGSGCFGPGISGDHGAKRGGAAGFRGIRFVATGLGATPADLLGNVRTHHADAWLRYRKCRQARSLAGDICVCFYVCFSIRIPSVFRWPANRMATCLWTTSREGRMAAMNPEALENTLKKKIPRPEPGAR